MKVKRYIYTKLCKGSKITLKTIKYLIAKITLKVLREREGLN